MIFRQNMTKYGKIFLKYYIKNIKITTGVLYNNISADKYVEVYVLRNKISAFKTT